MDLVPSLIRESQAGRMAWAVSYHQQCMSPRRRRQGGKYLIPQKTDLNENLMLKFSQRSVLKVRKDQRRDQHDNQMMFKEIDPKISPDKPARRVAF